MSDRDRPKKSWRERDAQRERGGERSGDRDKNFGNSALQAKSSKQYRAALDALFEKGGFDKVAELLNAKDTSNKPTPTLPTVSDSKDAKDDRSVVGGANAATATPAAPAPAAEDSRVALRKKLVEAQGKDAITRCFDKYCKQYGMPRDFEALECALDHTDSARVGEIMAAIGALLAKEKPRRARSLTGRLRFIEETSDDADLRAQAKSLREKL